MTLRVLQARGQMQPGGMSMTTNADHLPTIILGTIGELL